MKRIARILSGSGPLRRPHCSYREQGHTGALQVVHRSALIDRLLMSAFDPKRTLPDGARQSSKRQHILLLVQSSVAERTPVVPGLRRRNVSDETLPPRLRKTRARQSIWSTSPREKSNRQCELCEHSTLYAALRGLFQAVRSGKLNTLSAGSCVSRSATSAARSDWRNGLASRATDAPGPSATVE